MEGIQEYSQKIFFTISFAPQVGSLGKERGTELERSKKGRGE